MRPAAAAPAAKPHDVTALTVDGARRMWATRFRAAGIDAAELDARILVGHALGLDHAALAAAGMRKLSAEEENAIAAFGQRRLAHEPTARIMGGRSSGASRCASMPQH